MISPALLLVPAAGYVLAGGLLLWRQLGGSQRLSQVAMALAWVSAAAHATFVGLRLRQVPAASLTGAREFALLLSLLLVAAYLLTTRLLRGVGVGALVLAAAGAMLLVTAPYLPPVPSPAPPLLTSPWLLLHVPLLLLGYLACALAGSGAAMYLLVSGLLKARRPLALSGALPTLASLDHFSHRMAQIGFPLLTGGVVAGMVWSHAIWGQILPETPKQLLALATWGVYAAYFHGRLARKVRGRFCAWLLVVGLVLVVAGLLSPLVASGPHKFI